MRILLAILLAVIVSGTCLTAAPKQQEKGKFVFTEKEPQTGLNLLYGKQQLAEKLYMNATKYFRTYLQEEAKTTAERAEGTALLAEAYLLAGEYEESLENIKIYLATYGVPKDTAQKNALYLTAGQANIKLEQYPAALDFLKPLLEMPREELGDLRGQVLAATADAWNATGQWEATIQTLPPALEGLNVDSKESIALTWRILQAAIGLRKWAMAQNTIAVLEKSNISEDEKTTLKLLQLCCDVGEGKTEEALKFYQESGLSNKIPNQPNKQWWDALSTLAIACKSKGLQNEAAELFAAARMVTTNDKDIIAAAKNQAEALAAVNAIPKARNVLIEMHEKYPDDVTITIRLAEFRQELNERRSASELFLSVANSENQEMPLRYQSALKAASCLAQEGLAEDAEKTYRLAETLTTSPQEKTEALRYAAEQDEKLQRLDEAIALYQEVANRFGNAVPQALEARLEAGRLLENQQKNADAIQQFQLFLDACPSDSPLRWKAQLAIGNATVDPQQAVQKLLSVARDCPDSQLSSSAFLEAHSKALAINGTGPQMALDILNEFLAKHPNENPDKIRQVRLTKIILGFRLGNSDTLAWANTFINDYPNSTEAPEVALRIGDWYASENDYANAINQYRTVASFSNTKPELKVLALYEEAECSRECAEVTVPETTTAEDGTQITTDKVYPGWEYALKLLDGISSRTTIAEILARVGFLKGDILSDQRKSAEALAAYKNARESAGYSLMGYALLGRMAEINYAIGNTQEAKACIEEIRKNHAGGDPMLNARALLTLARCLKKEKNLQGAIDIYQRIRTEYEATRRNVPQETASPEVYVNAVKELLEMLDERGDTQTANIVRSNYKQFNKNGALPILP